MNIITSARELAFSLLDQLPPEFVYHNIGHTRYVAEMSGFLGKEEGLEDEEMEVVILAALFHDTGYTVSYPYHEIESRKIASQFLKEKGCSTAMIYKVLDCICVTRYPSYPSGLSEKVICDADLFHLASEDFLALNEALRNEWNLILKKNLSQKLHLESTLKFLKGHAYFTEYGKEILEERKQKNILRVRNLLYSI